MEIVQKDAVTDGYHVFWELGPMDHSYMLEKLTELGIPQFVEPPMSCTESLRAALVDYKLGNKSYLNSGVDDLVIEPLQDRSDGLALVRRKRGRVKNGHDTLFSVRVVPDGPTETLTVTKVDSTITVDEYTLLCNYHKYRQLVDTGSLGRSLVNILGHYHATCLKDSGGLYYLPGMYNPEFEQVAEVYKNGCGGRVSLVQIVMGDSARASIMAGITPELKAAAAEIVEQVATGDLGERALNHRNKKALTLFTKATEYEAILGEQLTIVREALTAAAISASSGIAIKEDKDLFNDMFLS